MTTETIDNTDAKLAQAFRRAYSAALSITIKRQSFWSAAAAGMNTLPIEAWIVLPTGETKIERAASDGDLFAIAARRDAQ